MGGDWRLGRRALLQTLKVAESNRTILVGEMSGRTEGGEKERDRPLLIRKSTAAQPAEPQPCASRSRGA
ncbi:hypothetical protein CK221_17220 [Mesorhizobium sp. WSM3868]|nr:hypothetical protein CK221_17220 [Mesorhizobium sp. WSM3868]